MVFARMDRPRTVRRRRKAKSKALTVSRVKRIALNVVGAELKFFNSRINLGTIPSITGSFVHITDGAILTQGDQVSQRTGNWIKPIIINGKLLVKGDAAAVVDVSEYRVCILQWNENQNVNAATLAKVVGDVLDPFQGFLVQNKGQYKILWTRIGIVSNDANNSNFEKYHSFRVKVPKQIYYDGAANKTNHIFMVGFSNTPAANGPPIWRFTLRLRYTDS